MLRTGVAILGFLGCHADPPTGTEPPEVEPPAEIEPPKVLDWFAPAVSYVVWNEPVGPGEPIGDLPYGVVAEDFNGDGHVDLATAACNTDNVTVILGNGDGTFGVRSFIATGACPRWLVSADFNGDGKPDLATANAEASTVSILLGVGDGTFSRRDIQRARLDMQAASSSRGIAAGDFNADGVTDLVTANAGDDVISVFQGQGNGDFATPREYPTAAHPVQVLVRELNGDNKLDFAVMSSYPGMVSIFLGRGDGTFDAHINFPTFAWIASLATGASTKTGIWTC